MSRTHLPRHLVSDLLVEVHVKEVARLIGQREPDGDGGVLRTVSDGHLDLRLQHSQTPEAPPVPVHDGPDGVLDLRVDLY